MNALHLTDEQIDELLIGETAAATQQHLAVCAACRERVAEERAGLEIFREATMAWGERRSAGMPLPSARRAARPAWTRVPALAAAAVLVAMGLGISVVKDFEGRRAPVVARGASGVEGGRTAAAQSAADIAADNRLLSEIDQALTAETPSLLETSQSDVAASRGKKAAEVRD